ncbi:hypothetical protein [Desulfocastanea catecholica]
MTDKDKTGPSQYTCNDYRQEMILLGLRQKLQRSDLTDAERMQLLQEINTLEKAIGF